MKKVVVVFTVFSILCCLRLSASTLDDAIALNKYLVYDDSKDVEKYSFKSSEEETVFKIIRAYANSTPQALTPKEIMDSFDANPFISNKNSLSWILFPNNPNASSKYSAVAKGIGMLMGGIDVTTFTEGLADFLVKRTKQELYATYFDGFYMSLDANEYLRYFFSDTYLVLKRMHLNVYDYAQYFSVLRTSFYRDLQTISDDVLNLTIEEGAVKELLVDGMDSKLKNAKTINKYLDIEMQPLELIKYPIFLTSIGEEYRLFFDFFNLVSDSLRSSDESNYWAHTINATNQSEQITPQSMIIYLGLLYQTAPDSCKAYLKELAHYLRGIDKGNLKNKIVEERLMSFSDAVGIFMYSTESVEQLMRRSRTETIGRREYVGAALDLFKAVGAVSKKVFEFSTSKRVSPPSDIPELMEISSRNAENFLLVLEISTHIKEIDICVQSREYSSALFESVKLLPKIFKSEERADKARLENFEKIVIKYGTFMSTVVNAESAEEVTAAIESVALPAGSYLTKRQANMSVGLNAYVGLAAALEDPDILDGYDSDESVFVLGLRAPVGFGLSWGSRSRDKSGGAVTIFGTIIDIGAIVSKRFDDSDLKSIGDIQLDDIFSPGIDLIWGIPNVPIATGLGFQFGPAIRESVDPEESDPLNGRFHLFVAVDIPILDFYVLPQ
jgi:hypothetical protein